MELQGTPALTVKDALHIMLAIEAHGIEAGLKELEHVDFYKIGPIDIVDKFYHRGHEFARAAMEAHPEWVKQNPKLSKYLEKQDAPVSKEENERRQHNYIPLIFELLKIMNEKGKLKEAYEKAKMKLDQHK